MGQGPTAEELLARAAERHSEALAALYERFSPSLMGMLLRILGDRKSAEDVLEETFLEIWHEARRLSRSGGSVAAALVLRARAKGVARSRAQRGLPAFDPGIHDRKWISFLPRPETVALLDERCELLKKVMNQLPQAQRQALDLAVFEGYTDAEIAEKHGEPLGKVTSGLLAGFGFLRHRLSAVMRVWAANI